VLPDELKLDLSAPVEMTVSKIPGMAYRLVTPAYWLSSETKQGYTAARHQHPTATDHRELTK
jgi:hypothetical protein